MNSYWSDGLTMKANGHWQGIAQGSSPTPIETPIDEYLSVIGGNFTVSTLFYEVADGTIKTCPLSSAGDIMRIEYVDTVTNSKLVKPKFTFQLGSKNRGQYDTENSIFKRWIGGFWFDAEFLNVFKLATSEHFIAQTKNDSDVNNNRYYSSSITDSKGNPIIPPYYFQGYLRTYCEPMENLDNFRKRILGGNMFGGGRAYFQWFEVVADSEIEFSYYWSNFKQYYRNKYFQIELDRG